MMVFPDTKTFYAPLGKSEVKLVNLSIGTMPLALYRCEKYRMYDLSVCHPDPPVSGLPIAIDGKWEESNHCQQQSIAEARQEQHSPMLQCQQKVTNDQHCLLYLAPINYSVERWHQFASNKMEEGPNPSNAVYKMSYKVICNCIQ